MFLFKISLDIDIKMLYNWLYNYKITAYRLGGMYMKAVITVTGKDSVGIIAKVSTICSEHSANIIDITQSVLSDYFAMIMLADIDGLKISFSDFVDLLDRFGKEHGLVISAMHEEVFSAMHHI